MCSLCYKEGFEGEGKESLSNLKPGEICLFVCLSIYLLIYWQILFVPFRTNSMKVPEPQ